MPTGQADHPSLLIENISVIRGDRLVLKQFSLSANAHNIIWIRGANGCGKSTLLRLIAGLLPRSGGNVVIRGKIGLCDENLGCDTNLTVKHALDFWADMDGATGDARHHAAAAMDLVSLLDVPVAYLSSGQRRRTALARIIGSGAHIWLLDEPYNGLDNANSARLDTALLNHSAGGGIALVAAHQPPTINVADSIALDQFSLKAHAL